MSNDNEESKGGQEGKPKAPQMKLITEGKDPNISVESTKERFIQFSEESTTRNKEATKKKK